MLNKAREWKLIRDVPDFKLFKEEGRALRLDDQAEAKLLPVAEQPLKDIVVLMRDTGMRNARELYRMRVENIDWNSRVIFNPNSKTKKGRRFIPMSDRVMNILRVRCADRTQGWVFPSRQKAKHITSGMVNKQWVRARKKAGLPENLVLYCARHDFGTYVLQKTGKHCRSHEQHGSLGCEDGHDLSAPGIERGTRRDQFTAHFTAHHRNR